MFDADDNQPPGAQAAASVAHASPVLENFAVAAAFLAGAIGFSVVLSQPLATVANESELEPAMLVSLHW